MAGARRMTEPNVLANISQAKFLFDSGNTEIVNLWREDFGFSSNVESFNHASAGTLDGVRFVVPAAKVFYLLGFTLLKHSGVAEINIQSNTTVDTATGGTTKWRSYGQSVVGWENGVERDLFIKFVATEYVTPVFTAGVTNMFYTGWGVLCDA